MNEQNILNSSESLKYLEVCLMTEYVYKKSLIQPRIFDLKDIDANLRAAIIKETRIEGMPYSFLLEESNEFICYDREVTIRLLGKFSNRVESKKDLGQPEKKVKIQEIITPIFLFLNSLPFENLNSLLQEEKYKSHFEYDETKKLFTVYSKDLGYALVNKGLFVVPYDQRERQKYDKVLDLIIIKKAII